MNSPLEMARGYIATGTAKTKLPITKMLLLAVMAGVFIAFGAIAATVVSTGIQTPGVARLVSGAVFPVGLALVLLAGSELFTGNCLIIIPVLAGSTRLSSFIKCLIIVYLGNFIGGIIIAALVVLGGIPELLPNEQLVNSIVNTALFKASMPFFDALVRGILCNILVCLAVWVSFSAKTAGGKLAVIYLPILAFVACGFEHSVANMYYIPAGIFTAAKYGISAPELTWGAMLVNNLLPVTIGNLIGGMAVGATYYGIYLSSEKSGENI